MTGEFYLGLGNTQNVDFYILKGIVEYTFEKKYLYNEQIKEYQGKSNYGVGFGINNKEFFMLRISPNI